MGLKILKGNITFADIPESKLRHFTRKDGTEDTGLDISIIQRKEPDKFGNTHAIYVTQKKEEWLNKEPKIFIGNARIMDLDELREKYNKQKNRYEDDTPF